MIAFFALCLFGLGGALSLLARLPGLIVIIVGVVLALAAVACLTVVGVETNTGFVVNAIVALVALQAGYGLAVVARGVLGREDARAIRAKTKSARANPEARPGPSNGSMG